MALRSAAVLVLLGGHHAYLNWEKVRELACRPTVFGGVGIVTLAIAWIVIRCTRRPTFEEWHG